MILNIVRNKYFNQNLKGEARFYEMLHKNSFLIFESKSWNEELQLTERKCPPYSFNIEGIKRNRIMQLALITF